MSQTAQHEHEARHEAEALAADLPALLLDARRLAAFAPGVHGRRRAGQGEDFWQYRDHSAEDDARLIDWRRSARGERYFVREREREAAQTGWFWIDDSAGFNWSSSPNLMSKRRRALAVSLALAMLFNRAGERIGALGQASRAGPRAIERLARDLLASSNAPPSPHGFILYASDFYAPIEQWRARLATAASVGAKGALLMIADPAEEDFPFTGRTRFTLPGGGEEIVLGRAEHAREEYARRLEAHRHSLRHMAANYGFNAILHRTDHSAAPALAALVALIADHV